MARSRYRFGEPNRPHFLTCSIVGWLPVFTRPAESYSSARNYMKMEALMPVLTDWR